MKLPKTPRKRVWLNTIVYRFLKLFSKIIGAKKVLGIILDLAWLMDKMALEYAYKTYSEDKHPNRQLVRPFILKYLKSTDKVIDFGSNEGVVSHFLAQHSAEVIGIELNKGAVERSSAKFKTVTNLRFVQGDALQFLQENKQQFDALILSHVFAYLDSPVEFLKRISPFFEKIYIETPDFEISYLNQYRLLENKSLIYNDPDYAYEYTRDELKEVITQAGLSVMEENCRFGEIKIWIEHKRR
jgi:ubiquinone/menaquinone biosynthesis C-methylase UbiE